MKWEYWFQLYLEKYCVAKGLRSSSISGYKRTLERFHMWAQVRLGKEIEPNEISTNHIIDFIKFLRDEKNNGDCAVNSQIVCVRMFYRAMVAMGQIEYGKSPIHHLPSLKAPKRKIKDVLTQDEVKALLNRPGSNTVIGLRDRAILALLYGTGIRASECAGVKEDDVDLVAKTVRVIGKGGYMRVVPLNESVVGALEQYRRAHGEVKHNQAFFQSRRKRSGSRAIIYDRVRRFSRLARIGKHVTPHLLRHTFATHLIRMGEKLVVPRDLLGHKQISSTQVYLHMSGEDLRNAVDRHPVGKLLDRIGSFLPVGSKLPFQHPPGTRFAFNN